jgi:hypothetical protein
MRTYDPYELIAQTRALTGACMMLRGFGIVPAADPLSHYARILDSPSWPVTDNRAAEESRQRAAVNDIQLRLSRTSGGIWHTSDTALAGGLLSAVTAVLHTVALVTAAPPRRASRTRCLSRPQACTQASRCTSTLEDEPWWLALSAVH